MTVLSVMLVGMAQPEPPRVSAVVIVRAVGTRWQLQLPVRPLMTVLYATLAGMAQQAA